MRVIYTIGVLLAVIMGDGYYFDGSHVTTIMTRAKAFDVAAEQKIGLVLRFNR
jgi:hypothetical protein